MKQIAYTNSQSVAFNVPSNGRYLLIAIATNAEANGVMLLVGSTSAGAISLGQVFKGSNAGLSFSTSTNKLTIAYDYSANRHYLCMPLSSDSSMLMSLIS